MSAVTTPAWRSWRFWFVPAWFALWIVIYAAMGIPKVPLEPLIVMLLYFAVATPVRAVPGWLLLLLFGIGNVVIPWATVLLQLLLRAVTTQDETFLGGVIAPVTEEIMKVLPVVVLYFWPRPKLRDAFGATDWMLCGAASGAGAQVWEDVLLRWQGSFSPGAPNLFGLPLVAGYTDNGSAVFIGHLGSCAFVALALGWARYIKRLAPPRLRPFAYVPAIFALIWMMVDHAGNNLRNARQWYWMFANAVYFLGGRGRLAPYVFLIAIAATIIFEMVVLRRTPKPKFAPLRPMSSFERSRRALRRLIRSHQMRYAWLSETRDFMQSHPGWSVQGFLRRSFKSSASASASAPA